MIERQTVSSHMNELKAIHDLLKNQKNTAAAYMEVIRNAEPLTYELFHKNLRGFVLTKYMLDENDFTEESSFDDLVEISLAKTMKIDKSLVEEFDTAQSCDGATSAMAKKVLLFMAIQKELNIELPAGPTARLKKLDDLIDLAWESMPKE